MPDRRPPTDWKLHSWGLPPNWWWNRQTDALNASVMPRKSRFKTRRFASSNMARVMLRYSPQYCMCPRTEWGYAGACHEHTMIESTWRIATTNHPEGSKAGRNTTYAQPRHHGADKQHQTLYQTCIISLSRPHASEETRSSLYLAYQHFCLAALYWRVLRKVKHGGQVVDQFARVRFVERIVEIPYPKGVFVVVPSRDYSLPGVPGCCGNTYVQGRL